MHHEKFKKVKRHQSYLSAASPPAYSNSFSCILSEIFTYRPKKNWIQVWLLLSLRAACNSEGSVPVLRSLTVLSGRSLHVRAAKSSSACEELGGTPWCGGAVAHTVIHSVSTGAPRGDFQMLAAVTGDFVHTRFVKTPVRPVRQGLRTGIAGLKGVQVSVVTASRGSTHTALGRTPRSRTAGPKSTVLNCTRALTTGCPSNVEVTVYEPTSGPLPTGGPKVRLCISTLHCLRCE